MSEASLGQVEFGEAGEGGISAPLHGFAFSSAADYLGWMILIQMEAPSSTCLPPAGMEQVVERAEGPRVTAGGAIHHWGCLYLTWGQSPVEQVVP